MFVIFWISFPDGEGVVVLENYPPKKEKKKLKSGQQKIMPQLQNNSHNKAFDPKRPMT